MIKTTFGEHKPIGRYICKTTGNGLEKNFLEKTDRRTDDMANGRGTIFI
jgi:hypothetical protein